MDNNVGKYHLFTTLLSIKGFWSIEIPLCRSSGKVHYAKYYALGGKRVEQNYADQHNQSLLKPLNVVCLCILIYAGLWKVRRLITRWSLVQVQVAPLFRFLSDDPAFKFKVLWFIVLGHQNYALHVIPLAGVPIHIRTSLFFKLNHNLCKIMEQAAWFKRVSKFRND
jgi:hypothetical protein